MNPTLRHYLGKDWELVRTTIRWYYVRNKKNASALRGRGVMTDRIVRRWYEPIYFWARKHWHQGRMPLWLAKFLLDERW